MIWLAVLIVYGQAVDAVTSTASVWVPVLLGVASLTWRVRRVPGRGRHRRTRGPDLSGQDEDTPSDIAALLPASQP